MFLKKQNKNPIKHEATLVSWRRMRCIQEVHLVALWQTSLCGPAGRAQCCVGTQGSTAWVWGQQRPKIQRHEPHQGRPGPFYRQLAPPQPRVGEKDRRVSALAPQEPKLSLEKIPRSGLEWKTGFTISERKTSRASAKVQKFSLLEISVFKLCVILQLC